MFKNWFKKETPSNTPSGSSIIWDDQAEKALDMSMAQAPVPQMLKGKLRSEMKKMAEAEAQKNGRTTVTTEDLLNGMMAKLPSHMQDKVKGMMEKGEVDPSQLK